MTFTKSLELNNNQPEVYNNLGNVLKNHGDFALALDAFDNALSLRDYYPEAQVNLCQVHCFLVIMKKALKNMIFGQR